MRIRNRMWEDSELSDRAYRERGRILMTALMVLLGGALGAPARMMLDRRITAALSGKDLAVWIKDFPFGTYFINMSGSFLLGFLTGISVKGHMPALLLAFLGLGFCGAYTTFSTWSFESVVLFKKRLYKAGFLNIFLSLILGLILAGVGIALGETI